MYIYHRYIIKVQSIDLCTVNIGRYEVKATNGIRLSYWWW
jgi:hypothetical protein